MDGKEGWFERFLLETVVSILRVPSLTNWTSTDIYSRCDYTGLTLEQCLGWGWTAAIHPDDMPEWKRKREEALQAGVAYEIEIRCRRHDGVYRWTLKRVQVVKHTVTLTLELTWTQHANEECSR